MPGWMLTLRLAPVLGAAELHYARHASPHEAGYDSFMTARALVRMAAHLSVFRASAAQREGGAKPPQAAGMATSDKQTRRGREKSTDPPLQIPSKMPPWTDRFWETYMNRLRVNGTVEGEVCISGGGHGEG